MDNTNNNFNVYDRESENFQEGVNDCNHSAKDKEVSKGSIIQKAPTNFSFAITIILNAGDYVRLKLKADKCNNTRILNALTSGNSIPKKTKDVGNIWNQQENNTKNVNEEYITIIDRYICICRSGLDTKINFIQTFGIILPSISFVIASKIEPFQSEVVLWNIKATNGWILSFYFAAIKLFDSIEQKIVSFTIL